VRHATAKLLRKDELDGFRCDLCEPGGGPPDHRIYFRARCHPRARLYACYQRATSSADGGVPTEIGVVVLECPQCKREVARILVGR
jgi:hypothetical protein